MYHDITNAIYIKNYKIKLYFENGKSGVLDFEKYVKKGGLFSRWKDMKYFKNFKINEELGIITWGDELDIAPETLYSEATGEPLPDWMIKERVG